VEYGRDCSITVTPSGTPQDEDILEIITVRPGFPESRGARLGWRVNGDTDYRGRDLHNVITHSECPDWQTGVNTGKRHPDIVGLPDGTMVCCADFPQIATDIRRVQVNIRSPAGAWAGWSTIHEEPSTGAAAAFFLYPRIIRLPNGSLEIYHYTYDHNALLVTVRRWVSLDDGVTWATDGLALLDTPISPLSILDMSALAVEYSNGQYCMLIGVNAATDRIEQWASRDLGATFTEIGDLTGASAAVTDPELCVAGGYFVALLQCNTKSECHRTADAFTVMAPGDLDVFNGASALGMSHALAVDDTGIIYGYNESFFAISHDYGAATWDPSVACTWWEDANESLDNINATFHRGVVWMVHNGGTAIAANAGPHSFHCTQMGGPSLVTLPERTRGEVLRRLAWHETYIPIQTLDAVTSMVYTAGGAPTILVQDGYQRTVNLISTADWADTDATNDLSVHARIAMSTTAGSTNAQYLTLRCADAGAADGWEIRIELSTTTLSLHDNVAGGAALATAAIAAGTEVDVLAAIDFGSPGANDGTCSVWYWVRDNLSDRTYTLLGASSTLATDGGAAPNAREVAYHVEASTTARLYGLFWHWEGVGSSSYLAARLSDGFSNPADLFGVPYSQVYNTYVSDGVSLRSRGYTRTGDDFTLTPDHSYAAEHVLPSVIASPRLGWRSATATTAQSLSFELASADSHIGNDIFAAYFDNINWRRVEIEFYIGAAWVSQGIFDFSESLGFVTQGDSIIPRETGATGTANRYIQRNEVVGGTFEYPSNKVRLINRNTEGSWDNGAIDEKRPVLWFDGWDGTEDAGPLTGGLLWYPRGMAIIHLNGASAIQRVRFTVNPGFTDPAPAAGYYEIGTLAFGPVAVMGWTPDDTRSVSRDLSGDVLEEQRDGTTIRDEVAPQARMVEFSWARASRITEYQNAGDPDFVSGSDHASAEPIADRWASPLMFEGLLSEHGRQPLVYVPRIPRGDGAGTETYSVYHNYCRGALYGRYMPGSYRLETVRGYAARDETVRTNVVTIKGER
jgi:hypothetical protein